MSEMRTVTKA